MGLDWKLRVIGQAGATIPKTSFNEGVGGQFAGELYASIYKANDFKNKVGYGWETSVAPSYVDGEKVSGGLGIGAGVTVGAGIAFEGPTLQPQRGYQAGFHFVAAGMTVTLPDEFNTSNGLSPDLLQGVGVEVTFGLGLKVEWGPVVPISYGTFNEVYPVQEGDFPLPELNSSQLDLITGQISIVDYYFPENEDASSSPSAENDHWPSINLSPPSPTAGAITTNLPGTIGTFLDPLDPVWNTPAINSWPDDRSSNGDGGSSYGDPDAGGRGASSGSDQSSSTAHENSSSSGASDYFGGGYTGEGYNGVGSGGYSNNSGNNSSGYNNEKSGRPEPNYGGSDGGDRHGRSDDHSSSYGNSDAGGGRSSSTGSSSSTGGRSYDDHVRSGS
ncbi:hypothetical protein ABLO22_23410, partial [Pseudovibrio sp. SCPC19]